MPTVHLTIATAREREAAEPEKTDRYLWYTCESGCRSGEVSKTAW